MFFRQRHATLRAVAVKAERIGFFFTVDLMENAMDFIFRQRRRRFLGSQIENKEQGETDRDKSEVDQGSFWG